MGSRDNKQQLYHVKNNINTESEVATSLNVLYNMSELWRYEPLSFMKTKVDDILYNVLGFFLLTRFVPIERIPHKS